MEAKYEVEVIIDNELPNLDIFNCVDDVVKMRVSSAMKAIENLEKKNGNQR